MLKNKTNSTKSFSFAQLHPSLGIRVSPISGEIEKNSSAIIVIEFHAHGNIVETLPMFEPDLRPTEADLMMTQSVLMSGSLSPLNDTKKSAGSAASRGNNNNKKDKNQTKEEVEHLTREFAAVEDAKKRVVKYCEIVSEFTREQLKQIQPWEQAVNDAQRVTQQLIQPGETAVDLLLSALSDEETRKQFLSPTVSSSNNNSAHQQNHQPQHFPIPHDHHAT